MSPSRQAPQPDADLVVDGGFVFAGGVTAGIDGALQVAVRLQGLEEAPCIRVT